MLTFSQNQQWGRRIRSKPRLQAERELWTWNCWTWLCYRWSNTKESNCFENFESWTILHVCQKNLGAETSLTWSRGVFGLGTQPVNYSDIGNFSAPSYFTSLKSEKLIPSLSWSYTAGARYRKSIYAWVWTSSLTYLSIIGLKAGQVAQLIFGGYDTSRFVPNQASFSLAPDVNRDLVVGIQSIIYSGSIQKPLLTTPTYAFIESTDPNIWLPEEACHQFEQAFGLSVDNATGLYLMSESKYFELRAADPQVTFTLANSLSGGQSVNIVLPFKAFALKAAYPFVKSSNTTTYYFPLRKSKDNSQNTLGRAFLQEA